MKCSVCNKDLLPEGFEIDVRQVNALTPKHYQEAFSNYCTCGQPKPTDKDQAVEKDWSKAQETLKYGIDECNKLLDKPDSQLTDTDGTDCIKQMTIDKAFNKWFKERELDAADIEIESMAIGFSAGFTAGQEDRDKEAERYKGLYEHRKAFSARQQEQIQHLQSKLDKAVELIENIAYLKQKPDHFNSDTVRLKMIVRAEQFLDKTKLSTDNKQD